MPSRSLDPFPRLTRWAPWLPATLFLALGCWPFLGKSVAPASAQNDGEPDAEVESPPAVSDDGDAAPTEDPRSPAIQGPGEVGPPRSETPSRSRSVGATNRGRLLHSVALESPLVHVRNPNARYGTAEFVGLITWAAEQVEHKAPGAQLLLGDISRQRGGRLRPHRSHRAGRDADIGFYLLDEADAPAENRRFIRLRRDGTGPDRRTDRTLHFDDVRNWALVAALLGQDVVPVQYIMVIAPLKERLLAEGERQNAPAWLMHRVREAVGPRRSGRGRAARYGTHNSHFHVRVYCDGSDLPRCRDVPPFWDWVTRPRPPRTTSRARRRRRATMSTRMRPASRARSRRPRSRTRAAMGRSTMRRSTMTSRMRATMGSSMNSAMNSSQ